MQLVDCERWADTTRRDEYHQNDDVWLILLRALAQSNMRDELKLAEMDAAIACCGGVEPPILVRAALAKALGDMRGASVQQRLRTIAASDPDPLVRSIAVESLVDLDR